MKVLKDNIAGLESGSAFGSTGRKPRQPCRISMPSERASCTAASSPETESSARKRGFPKGKRQRCLSYCRPGRPADLTESPLKSTNAVGAKIRKGTLLDIITSGNKKKDPFGQLKRKDCKEDRPTPLRKTFAGNNMFWYYSQSFCIFYFSLFSL